MVIHAASIWITVSTMRHYSRFDMLKFEDDLKIL